ncbi:Protein hgh1 [Cladophialophora chaetospira]|uniref:Protein HGH1 homolog n=1 Tax=Cladophialophora chaetospira TaxID=386627 RepID=A0AA39CGN9_9EURO|nr:Protein hgh1 [Cladophialophora chaetospira]
MPTELEELVEFLHHGNTQIRQVACEHLVGHSKDAAIFKRPQLVPVQDLKLLVRDYPPIAKNALTILINISHDAEVLENLAADDAFLETLLKKITNPKEETANEIAMLLSNLAKADHLSRLIKLKRPLPPPSVSTSPYALDQLLDCFVKGADATLNKHANYDYLAYLLADLSKHKAGRDHFLSKRPYDGVVPISKLTVFTEHKSHVRRRGVASTLKNVAFEVDEHRLLLADETETVNGVPGVNILPYILLPLAGSEEYPDDEAANMLPDLQLLPPDKMRESDNEILVTHLETLLLLTTTREGREKLRQVQVYPLVRETHAHVQDEGVSEACDRLVQILMRDEVEEEESKVEEVDEDERLEEIF